MQSPASKAESVEERISLRRSPAAPGGVGWADKSPDKSPEVRRLTQRFSREGRCFHMLDDSSLLCGADGLVAASGGAAGAVAAEQCDTRRDLIAGGVAQPGLCRCEQRLRLGVRSAHATARRCAAGSMTPILWNSLIQ